MTLKILNNSTYNAIKIICNQDEHTLTPADNIINIAVSGAVHIKVLILDENKFTFNLPAVLTSSFTHKDSECSIKCNLEFDLAESGKNANAAEIIIENDSVNYKKRFRFESVKIVSPKARVLNETLSLTNTDKIISRHKKFNLLMTSLFPIVLINFILGIADKDILFFIIGILAFFIFSVPSIADIKKLNKICRSTDLVQKLFEQNSNKA